MLQVKNEKYDKLVIKHRNYEKSYQQHTALKILCQQVLEENKNLQEKNEQMKVAFKEENAELNNYLKK